MAYLSDKQIKELCSDDPQTSMIYPCVATDSRLEDGRLCPSYGLSSYGYDIRLGSKFFVSIPGLEDCAEPLILETAKKNNLQDQEAQDMFGSRIEVDGELVLEPGEFCLGYSLEHFNMPKDVVAVCMGKSTLARLGILVVVTPLEPGWKGHLTLEIYNLNANPVRLTPGIGITQINFMKCQPCEIDYSAKEGKYQNQPAAPVLPMLKCPSQFRGDAWPHTKI